LVYFSIILVDMGTVDRWDDLLSLKPQYGKSEHFFELVSKSVTDDLLRTKVSAGETELSEIKKDFENLYNSAIQLDPSQPQQIEVW
jgi:hypothetical protein